MISIVLLSLLIAAFVGCSLRTFFLFDQILRQEHGEHPKSWEEDGRPIGFFWIPKGGEVVAGSIARSGLFFKWAFSRPRWAEPVPDLIPLFAKLRRSLIVGVCLWVVAMLVLFALPK